MSTIMPETILTINHFPRSDRSKEMVVFARNNVKLAKTEARTQFLYVITLSNKRPKKLVK